MSDHALPETQQHRRRQSDVKVSDAVVAAKVFRQTIHDYCKQLSGLEVLVPLSVTVDVDTPNDLLPSENDLKGEILKPVEVVVILVSVIPTSLFLVVKAYVTT